MLSVKVRRLEEVAQRNEEELSALSVDGKAVLLPTTNADTGWLRRLLISFIHSLRYSDKLFLLIPRSGNCASADNGAGGESGAIQSEISALKARLAGTDMELQKTNNTLRYGGQPQTSHRNSAVFRFLKASFGSNIWQTNQRHIILYSH